MGGAGPIAIRELFSGFLNLWFGKPMVCVRVACHENDGKHENDENDKGNSDSYKQGVECWIHGNHGNHKKITKTTGIEGANHGFPKARVFANGKNTQRESA